MDKQKFIKWFNKELNKHGWSQSELARRARLSTATVSDVINGKIKPGLKFYEGVARAFRIPLDEVLRRAGLLPPTPDEDSRLKELVHWFLQLDEASQEVFLTSIRALAEEQARREQETSKHGRTGEAVDKARR